MKKNIIKSYKFKFLFFLILFLIATCSTLISFAIRDTKITTTKIYAERGSSILNKTLAQIDTQKFIKLSKTMNKNDPYFDELYKIFNSIKNQSECEYLYAMKPLSGTIFSYIIDGTDQNDTEHYSEIGTAEDISSYGQYPFICMKNKEIVYSEFKNQDDWGWMITIYSPILDENSESIGFLAVDFKVDAVKNQIESMQKRLVYVGLIITFVIIILMLSLILGFFKSFNSVVVAMKNISAGAKELTVRLDVPKSTELGNLCNSFNDVIGSMQHTMQTVSSSVGAVNSNSTKILEQTRQLLGLIDNVSGNIDDVQSKATSQTTLITSLETNTNDLESSINLLNLKIKEQEETVTNSIHAINSIIESINRADTQINTISQEYQTIVEETKTNEKKQNDMTEKIKFIEHQASNLSTANSVITGITTKTNLLAMNAAIEASHAGEAGKGFSVVASEIRALAENSARQTQNITNIVDGIDEAIKQIVTVSNESEKAFSSLGHRIENLSLSMKSIKENMNHQNQNATSITAMMEILNDSTASISNASNTINEKTQSVVKGINTMKFSIKRINQTSESAQNLLNEMTSFSHDTNSSSENNKKAVDDINELVESYKF